MVLISMLKVTKAKEINMLSDIMIKSGRFLASALGASFLPEHPKDLSDKSRSMIQKSGNDSDKRNEELLAINGELIN